MPRHTSPTLAENPSKRRRLSSSEDTKEIKKKFVEDRDKVDKFYKDYMRLLKLDSNQSTLIRVKSNLHQVDDIIKKFDEGFLLNVAIFGDTDQGKSTLTNYLATNNSGLKLVSTGDPVDGGKANTTHLTKISYNDKNRVSICKEDGSIESVLEGEDNFESFVRQAANKKMPEEETLKYKLVEGQFSTLKDLNICITDTPGLNDTDYHEQMNKATGEVDVVVLICKDSRGQVKDSYLKNLEQYFKVPEERIPHVIVIHNDLKESASFKNDDKIRDEFLKFFKQSDVNPNSESKINYFAAHDFLPGIDGNRREVLFKGMHKRTYGLKIGKIEDKITCIKDLKQHLEDIRIHKTEELIDPGTLYLIQSAYLMSLSLKTSSFKKGLATELSSTIDIIKKKLPILNYKDGTWSSEVSQIVQKLIEDESISEQVKLETDINTYEKLRDKLLPNIILEEICRFILDRHKQNIIDILFETDDSIEVPEEDTQDEYSISRALANTIKKFKCIKENDAKVILSEYLTSLTDFVIETTNNTVQELVDSSKEFTAVFKSYLKKKDLLKKDVIITKDVLIELVRGLVEQIGKSHSEHIKDKLFGVTLRSEVIAELQRYQKGRKENNNKALQTLSRSITTWFNTNERVGSEPMDKEHQVVRYCKSDENVKWNVFEGPKIRVDDNMNTTTKSGIKRQETMSTKNLPTDPVSTYLQNHVGSYKVELGLDDDEDRGRFIDVTIDPEKKEVSIKYYQNWIDDLKDLMTDPDGKLFIDPIFVPTKGRRKILSESILFKADELQKDDFKHLIYVVVEYEQFEEYRNQLINHDVVFITIPGGNRGVAFSRAMIKLVQEQMRKNLKEKHHIIFDWYWMIDDDIKSFYKFNTSCVDYKFVKPCTTALALYDTRRNMQSTVQNYKDALVMESGGCIDELDDFAQELQNVVPNFKNKPSKHIFNDIGNFTKFIKHVQVLDHGGALKFLVDALGIKKELDEEVREKFKTWFSKFCEAAEAEVSKKCRITTIAFSKYGNNVRTNYNLVSMNQQYRYSLERHACILSYAPSIIGYNYLPDKFLFLPPNEVEKELKKHQIECKEECMKIRSERLTNVAKELKKHRTELEGLVDEELEEKKKTLPEYKYRDYFLGEDKKFVERLNLDNRTGFVVHYYNVEYGKQKRGGCFRPFRFGNMY